MKSFLVMLGAVALGLAYMIATQKRATGLEQAAKPVEDLAHKLQDAWADHHTVA